MKRNNLYLYNNASFSRGFARAIDVYGDLSLIKHMHSGANADIRALSDDWLTVMNDLNDTYVLYVNQYEQEKQEQQEKQSNHTQYTPA